MTSLNFIEVAQPALNEHIEFLFALLCSRQLSISHQELPSYKEHAKFVENHPYAKWLIVQDRDQLIGAIYISKDNSVGFHFLPEHELHVPQVLSFFLARFKPLPPIKSLRSNDFFFNVAPNDIKKIELLEKLGFQISQLSYQKLT